jgi:CubicO group peptidase (beta-lactamase class C family)
MLYAGTKSRRWRGLVVCLAVVMTAVLPGCGTANQGKSGPTAVPPTAIPTPTTGARFAGAPDYWPTTDWRTSTPEEQGVDSVQLLQALARMDALGANVRSITVIRNGYIVLEAYHQPFTHDLLNPVASVTKSVIGDLTGIALAEGAIKDIKQPALGFFPGRQIANRDSNKEAMTVEDLLTMRPGLRCADQDIGFEVEMSADWVQHILDLPTDARPGEKFVYCTSGPHLLSAILTKATGMSTNAYAQSRLFDPLGIGAQDFNWAVDPQGITVGGYGIEMRPRDMAKLGLLFLNDGKWEDMQVVPKEWVAASTRAHTAVEKGKDYGYLYWVYPSHYAAEGRGEQKIQVIKDRNMVVVITAAIDWHNAPGLEKWLQDYIIPAAASDSPLPANPTAQAALQAKEDALANPIEPVPPLPETALRISGKAYELKDNAAGLKTMTITFTEGSGEALAVIEDETGKTELHVGMDNVYRLNQGELGPALALRGRWTSDTSFVVKQLLVPGVDETEYRLYLGKDKLNIEIEDVVFGTFKYVIGGQAK